MERKFHRCGTIPNERDEPIPSCVQRMRSVNLGWVLAMMCVASLSCSPPAAAAPPEETRRGVQEWIQQAYAYYSVSDFSSASVALDQAELLEPGSAAVRLQRALVLDALGQFAEARYIYKQLLVSEASTQVLIPSAINSMALSRMGEASAMFKRVLRKARSAEERDYARLWLGFLALREPAGLQVARYEKKHMETRRYVLLMDVIAGSREVDEVANAVKTMRFSSGREQRTVTAEYYFFLGSIERARFERDSANKLLRMALGISDGSVERPLIVLFIKELRET